MTDTNHCIGIPESPSEKFVRQHPNSTVQLEQAVICEDGPDSLTRFPLSSSSSVRESKKCCMVHRFVSETAECGMTVEDLDLFSDNNVPQIWQEGEEIWQSC